MYLAKAPVYYRGSEQVVQRAPFLLLIGLKSKPCGPDNAYACVRKVALHQFGQFMMGRANLCGKWVVVSGSYGNDGLIKDVEELPKDAVPLPAELYEAWNKGGGWNSAGSEALPMREWAKETFKLKR